MRPCVCVGDPSPSLQMLLREWGGPGVSGCLWKVALIRVPGKPASLPPSPFPSLVQELKEAQLVSDEALREGALRGQTEAGSWVECPFNR